MPAYISLELRPSQHQKLDPANPTNKVCWVTASSLPELSRMEKKFRQTWTDDHGNVYPADLALSRQTRCNFLPQRDPANYRTKARPIWTVDAAVLPAVQKVLRPVVLPERYFRVAMLLLKRDIFTQLAQGHLSRNLPTPSASEIDTYYRPKLVNAIADLLSSGDWIDDPAQYSPDNSSHAVYLEELHERIRAVPLGRQSHMVFSSTSLAKRRFRTPNPVLDWTAPLPPLPPAGEPTT